MLTDAGGVHIMTDEQTTTDAGQPRRETRAARLTRLLAVVLPKDQQEALKTGEWGRAGAPYVFDVLPDGRQRLRVSNRETGEVMGFVGSDRNALLDAFEKRVAPAQG